MTISDADASFAVIVAPKSFWEKVMFKCLILLSKPHECAFCGRTIQPGDKAVCEFTLLGRKFYHTPCMHDKIVADNYFNSLIPFNFIY